MLSAYIIQEQRQYANNTGIQRICQEQKIERNFCKYLKKATKSQLLHNSILEFKRYEIVCLISHLFIHMQVYIHIFTFH